MIETSFAKWRLLRESSEDASTLPAGYDPFTTLQQRQGDVAYFGVHDLSKFYRQNGQLPDISGHQIVPKGGEVVNADPVNQTITVATKRAPFHYGYHKIEDDKAKQKRKVDDQGRILVTLPVTHLQDVSHMVPDAQGRKIWLVVDGNTKYQQGLMKEIRRKEVERAHAGQTQDQQPPEDEQPQGPPDMPPQQPEDQQGPPQGGYDDMSMGGQGDQQGPPQGGYDDMSMGGQPQPPMGQQMPQQPPMGQPQPPMGQQMPQQPPMGQPQPPMGPMTQAVKKNKYKMVGREVVPDEGDMGNLDVAHYDPSILSNGRYWKRHTDCKYYGYVKS